VVWIKRHSPRCDLQAASCRRARSRLNSVCATRFSNAILVHRTGIPIVLVEGRMYRSRKSTFRLRRRIHVGGRSPAFDLAIYTRLSFSLIVIPMPLHPSPDAKCKTHVESSKRSYEKRFTLVTLEWDERGGVLLMAGNNRMISPLFASPTNLLIRKFSRCLDGNVSGRIKVTSLWTLVDLQAPTLSRLVPVLLILPMYLKQFHRW